MSEVAEEIGRQQQMNHAPFPRGPAGRIYYLTIHSSSVMRHSKNPRLAKDFIRHYMAKEQYGKWFDVMGGYGQGPTKLWYDSPVWTRDPKLFAFRDPIKDARAAGYAGPPSRQASEPRAIPIRADNHSLDMRKLARQN